MGIRFGAKWFMALLVGAVMFSCSDDALMEAPQVMEQDEQKEVATLIAGFTKEDTESRLAYEIQKSGGIKMTWAVDDNLTATPAPSDESWAYTFTLSKGAGTNTGTFTCSEKIDGYLPMEWPYSSTGWTLYFPGSIEGEQDWFDKSYVGQKQTGDNNINHLKDYHSIRLRLSESADEYISFKDTYINFSGDNVDESKCVKFNLSGFESSKPTKIELMYMNPSGVYESCFHTHNYLDEGNWIYPTSSETTSRMTLDLDGFTSNVTNLTAYMMMSNYPVEVEKGGKFRVYLTTTDSKKYYCDVAINKDVTLEGSHLYSITCNKWTSVTDGVDGMKDAKGGVVVLQEATKGNPGTDIIIMGDGFAADKFTAGGEYETAMRKAYNDFFSIEPYRSLKDYFNVYYINAVSEDDHDADPKGLANGAYQGTANTVFKTQFTVNATRITGADDVALKYAKQAIRKKGGKGGTVVTEESEINTRSNTALIMVMVNVYAHAGTCSVVWANGYDYGKAYSVAYTALGNDRTGMGSKWTTIHEAGGHGFGKLADEYDGDVYSDSFDQTSNSEWIYLDNQHACGVSRNADKYWGSEEVGKYGSPAWGVTTTEDNVYWSALLNATYAYKTKEGLSFYRGANTMSELFCRPTDNSVMRDQFATNGHFFNAPSRWAIWYRLMRLTNSITATKFEDSLNEFIDFDQNLTITMNDPSVLSRSAEAPQELKPLAPPILIKGEWINDRLVLEK